MCVEEQQFFFASKIHIKNQSKKSSRDLKYIKRQMYFLSSTLVQSQIFGFTCHATETLSRRGRVVKAFGCYSKHKNM